MDIQLTAPSREQSRARYPDSSGYIKRDGVRLYYEVYGSGGPTVFLLPTWSIIHSRHWKMQIPYLARHCRVVTFDGRGNGRSDRPTAGYEESEFAADALAVMHATMTERAVLVSLSVGAQRALILAAEHPSRVSGAVFICPAVPGQVGDLHLPVPGVDDRPGRQQEDGRLARAVDLVVQPHAVALEIAGAVGVTRPRLLAGRLSQGDSH